MALLTSACTYSNPRFCDESTPCRGLGETCDLSYRVCRPPAGRPDAGPDAGPRDAEVPDTGAPDTGAPDAAAPDAGAEDTGPTTVGYPNAGRVDARLQDRFWGARVTVPRRGVLAAFGLVMDGPARANFALYRDAAGGPGAKVANAEKRGVSLEAGAARIPVTLAGIELVPGDYWIFVVFEALSQVGTALDATTATCQHRDATSTYAQTVAGMPSDMAFVTNCGDDNPLTLSLVLN